MERLNESLRQDHGFARKVTLISAPAGFGKTTLVSEWVAACRRPAAWLSLDEGDSDPRRFLAYLVAALQTIVPDMGEGVLAMLQSPQPAPMESILTTLLNDVTTIRDDFVLVLDDYHLVDARAPEASTSVDGALTFLLEYLPPQMHLVITTREDPNLPLARLRGRGQLTEVRSADLRFSDAEAGAFLTEVMDLALAAEDVTSLETRTEGWIAGLQLAALALQGLALQETHSMRGPEDVSEFIRAFAGDNRYIVDYLVEEVLQHQPQHVRSFLLQTSILDRLSGPLCNVVVGRTEIADWGAESNAQAADNSPISSAGSQKILEYLERANLFVVPLDDRRQWYRYHHLFADVLQARAMEAQPDQVPLLHRRASQWFEENGSTADAVQHALAAEDFQRAARLVELAWSEMDRSRQSATWLGWAQALPEELVCARPVLSVGYAWALLDSGEPEAAEARLGDAERWLGALSDGGERPKGAAAGMVVDDEEEFRSLPATIATARAYQAQALGDVPGSVQHARRALQLLPEDDHLRRGIAAALLGLAIWTTGDLEAAYHSFAGAMADFESAGNVLFAITGTYILADIRMAQGRLREAIRTYERSLQLATEQGGPLLRGRAELHLGLSELLREQGHLEAATQHLQRSEELGEQTALPRWKYHWCLAQARIKEAQGDLEGALDLLDEAQRRYIRGPVPDTRPIAALKTKLWVAQGRLAQAQDWAREEGLGIGDELSYLREFEHVTLARLLIARYKRGGVAGAIREAMDLLDRLLKAAEVGGRTGSAIEILLLQALAHEAQGDIPLALAPLERALALAEPEGYVRIFVDEGLAAAHLLSEAAARGIMPEYTGKLLAAFEAEKQGSAGESAYATSASSQSLIEPLSSRELEVLQLVAQGLSNREISERLFIALSTVKGHNRNIYGKLQVQRRTEAVVRARELDLT